MVSRENMFASAEYDQLIIHVTETHEPIVVEAADAKERHRIAWRFYRYRTLLQKSEIPHRRELGRIADFIMLRESGKTVTFLDRRDSREASLLRGALKAAGAKDPTKSLEQLANERAVSTEQIAQSISSPSDSNVSTHQDDTLRELYGPQEEDKD